MYRNGFSSMKMHILPVCSVCLIAAGRLFAQSTDPIELGNLIVRPSVTILGAYNDRVIDGPLADGDRYAETEAALSVENREARYNLYAAAAYGHRFYDTYTGLSDDFYTLRAAVGSSENPLMWKVMADWNKTLNYDTTYDPASGQTPDSILTDDPNRRLVASAQLAYDKAVSDMSSIRPGYRLTHYYQEFDADSEAEWQIHYADLQLRRRFTERTEFYMGAGYSLQVNDEEDGYIGSLFIGAEGQASEKTSWLAELGVAHAEYDLSGADDGFVSRLRGDWKATEKVSVYLFGGNEFQPGYNNGAARWVYRLGYGADWRLIEKVRLEISLLHDYQDVIGDNVSNDPRLGVVRHFFNSQAEYRFTDRLLAALGYEYTHDEKTPDRNLGFLEITYSY